jgi:hypothetical protein
MAVGPNEQGWCVAIAGVSVSGTGGGRADKKASSKAEGNEGGEIGGMMGDKTEAEVAEAEGCLVVKRVRLVAVDGECGVITRLAEEWELLWLNCG